MHKQFSCHSTRDKLTANNANQPHPSLHCLPNFSNFSWTVCVELYTLELLWWLPPHYFTLTAPIRCSHMLSLVAEFKRSVPRSLHTTSWPTSGYVDWDRLVCWHLPADPALACWRSLRWGRVQAAERLGMWLHSDLLDKWVISHGLARRSWGLKSLCICCGATSLQSIADSSTGLSEAPGDYCGTTWTQERGDECAAQDAEREIWWIRMLVNMHTGGVRCKHNIFRSHWVGNKMNTAGQVRGDACA